MSDDFYPEGLSNVYLIPSAPPGESCDTWGNIQGEPLCTVEERHGNGFVRIFIFSAGGRFYYGYQISIGTMVKQKTANINAHSFGSADFARSAASIEIERICNTNKNVKKMFADFIKIRYNQGSLFEWACV